ncbi:uncharacterized protein BDZ99DRAFT_303240 [Mytilinidion resinicola]|uniref:Uncharacterized protein n=1 Tax=Mytilinidion resinicola TaxID=574789 RepID=A0A6A6YMG9_9PEZI|nr:uncharacterized protein BDZ99DRAFT_303240 [Mytilinidion resinicola]KAF2810072.1 hypothetical protein BDZ99DRAFT_303240 [Mytilinidion resinicola]
MATRTVPSWAIWSTRRRHGPPFVSVHPRLAWPGWSHAETTPYHPILMCSPLPYCCTGSCSFSLFTPLLLALHADHAIDQSIFHQLPRCDHLLLARARRLAPDSSLHLQFPLRPSLTTSGCMLGTTA